MNIIDNLNEQLNKTSRLVKSLDIKTEQHDEFSIHGFHCTFKSSGSCTALTIVSSSGRRITIDDDVIDTCFNLTPRTFYNKCVQNEWTNQSQELKEVLLAAIEHMEKYTSSLTQSEKGFLSVFEI